MAVNDREALRKLNQRLDNNIFNPKLHTNAKTLASRKQTKPSQKAAGADSFADLNRRPPASAEKTNKKKATATNKDPLEGFRKVGFFQVGDGQQRQFFADKETNAFAEKNKDGTLTPMSRYRTDSGGNSAVSPGGRPGGNYLLNNMIGKVQDNAFSKKLDAINSGAVSTRDVFPDLFRGRAATSSKDLMDRIGILNQRIRNTKVSGGLFSAEGLNSMLQKKHLVSERDNLYDLISENIQSEGDAKAVSGASQASFQNDLAVADKEFQGELALEKYKHQSGLMSELFKHNLGMEKVGVETASNERQAGITSSGNVLESFFQNLNNFQRTENGDVVIPFAKLAGLMDLVKQPASSTGNGNKGGDSETIVDELDPRRFQM